MTSELSYETSDEASENELLDRSLSVWRGWSAIEWEDFTPIALDLHTACSIGQYDWVRSLIARNDGLDLDRKNHGGWTPLMYACYIGHDNIVNLLINAGCQMNMKNPRGHTPLILAASCGNESVARTLIRNGAELELTDKCGWTALFHATYAGHQNFVAFLLETGANMDAVEPVTGMTPFMEAAGEGHEIIVQLFLQHGVNVNSKAYNGDMARSLALINGYMKIVSLIDNHAMPLTSLRSEPGLDFYLGPSDDRLRKQPPTNMRTSRGKSKGPSIRDGPEAIARMINRTRNTDVSHYSALLPKGYLSFTDTGDMKSGGTHLSHRDVTSPINLDDLKDSSGITDLDDYNDESNAFTKTGAITIKSSSSSSGGLIAALGLSREGSLDSDDSRLLELNNSTSEPPARNNESTERKSPQSLHKNSVASSDFESASFAHNDLAMKSKDGMDAKSSGHLPSVIVSPEDVNANGKEKEKEKPWAVVSPLRDYFPIEVPFQVSYTCAPCQNTDQMGAVVSAPFQGNQNTIQRLPQDNMTQAEIVSRYLDNLNLGAVPKKVLEVSSTREDGIQPSGPIRQRDGQNSYITGGNLAGNNYNKDNMQGVTHLHNVDHWMGDPSKITNNEMVPSPFAHRNEGVPQTAILQNMAGSKGMVSGNKQMHLSPAHVPGPLMQNHEQLDRNQMPRIPQDRIQNHSSVQRSENLMPSDPCSPTMRETVPCSLPSLSPFVPSNSPQTLPSSILPSSLHHHHHHHHFHNTHQPQQNQNVHSVRSPPPSSSGDQNPLFSHPYHTSGSKDDYLTGMAGYFNFQGGGESHGLTNHPYLQTVPPELYYRDVDSSPQINPGNTSQPRLQMAPLPAYATNNVSVSDAVAHHIQTALRDFNNFYDCEMLIRSNAEQALTAECSVPGASENMHIGSSSIQHSTQFQDLQSGYQDVMSNPSATAAVGRGILDSGVNDMIPIQMSGGQVSGIQGNNEGMLIHQRSSHNHNASNNIQDTPNFCPSYTEHMSTGCANSETNALSEMSKYVPLNMASSKGATQGGITSATKSQPLNPSVAHSGLQEKTSTVLDASQDISTSLNTVSSVTDMVSSSPAHVMIPGHVTSQPISQSIAWLNQSERVGGGPKDLHEMLTQLGLTKYLDKFEEQDVDLPVFLSLTDNDLKELGIKLFGPRKKMTNAIARWHSNAPLSCSELEQAYADRLEGEMQEMAIQLNQACANEESLKAQVLQEQQLRSVTEGCLMEMRMSWCQARQLIQDGRGTMRSMGELLSRLRHNQKDIKKTIVSSVKDWDRTVVTGNSMSGSKSDSSTGHANVPNTHKQDQSEAGTNSGNKKDFFEGCQQDPKASPAEDHSISDSNLGGIRGDATGVKTLKGQKTSSVSDFESMALEMIKRSEKCIKDLQQALTGLVHNTDHILKSTQTMNTLEKDMT